MVVNRSPHSRLNVCQGEVGIFYGLNLPVKPALDKHEERGPTGTPLLSLLSNLISDQLIVADKREILGP